MRILITGADGFVGGHLIDLLAMDSTNEIIAVGGPNRKPSHAYNRVAAWDCMDLADRSSIRRVVETYRPEQVYHLAGIAVTHGIPAGLYHQINSTGTYWLANEILETVGESCVFMYISSAGVYAPSNGVPIPETFPLRPKSDYGASKSSGEMLLWPLHQLGLDLRIVRPFNHTGPRQGTGFVCADWARRIRDVMVTQGDKAVSLTVRGLHSVRDFTDVRDVVRAYEIVMNHGASGMVVNVCSGIGESVEEIITTIAEIAGANVVLEGNMEATDRLVGDNHLIHSTFGWEPRISLRQSLEDLWNYMVGPL